MKRSALPWLGLAPLLGLALLGPAATPAAASEGFRCGTRVVAIGARLSEVRSKCGAPDDATTRVEKREIVERRRARSGDYAQDISERRTVEVTIDEWTYDFGRSKFVRYLRFENGQLASVSEGDWGTSERGDTAR